MRTITRVIGMSVLVGAALATTACGSGDDKATATPSTAPTTAAVPSAATGSLAGGCPVTGDALVVALKDTDLEKRLAAPVAFETPQCEGGFAVAWTRPAANVQPAGVLFGYDATTRAWKPLNLGSAGFCDGFVPKEIAGHFKGCGA